MSIINRLKAKIQLWLKFQQIADNFFSILLQRILAVAHLSRVFTLPSTIELKNGIKLAQNKILDVSAVPVTVEVWGNQTYVTAGYPIGAHDTVIDIGANVGSFSIYASTKTDGNIYAFEPLPENVALIKKSIALNSIANVTVVPAAVAAVAQDIKLSIAYSNAMHSTIARPTNSDISITVPAINIEEYCAQNNIGVIDYLKMDCEGGEYDIVLNWSNQFAQTIKVMVLEYHDHPEFKYVDLMQRLTDQGFSVRESEGHYIFAERL